MRMPLAILAACCIAIPAMASETRLDKVEVSADLPALERGMDTLMNACRSCHGMKYIKYRDLAALGMDKQKVDVWRDGQPMDAALLAQMSENDAMQAYGKAPPDLSLIAKAREGGANYVYSYLLGYYVTPEGMPGNHIFPETRMPDILGISGATDEAQRAEIRGKARDLVSFLAWAADPHAQERRRLGYYVLGYLFVLTILLYLVKKQIWSRLE